MHKLLLLLFLVPLLVMNCVDCPAKPARSLNASISAEPDDVDRGVLGVRYAVAMDLLKKTHVIVMNVVPGGPAEAAGLKRGDRIVAIDGVQVKTLSVKGIGPRMKGAPDTILRLSVRRGLDDLELALTRGGLTKLPESAFKSRMIADAVTEEREARIKALCKSLSAIRPDVCAAIESGDFRNAEMQLQRALRANPSLRNAELLYALILDRTGKSNGAKELLENLVAKHPQWPDAWQSLALYYEARGDYTDSIVALKKAAVLVTDKDVEASIRQRISELSLRKKN